MNWFEVDKAGLAKILAKRGKEFIVYELLQNAWDQNSNKVSATLEKLGRGKARLVVADDDPNGFSDLSHAWTLFAENNIKRANPSMRGRFDLGEKLVLALCDEAEVVTTTGSVVFDANGRHRGRKSRDVGSVFSGIVRLSNDEFENTCLAVKLLLPPKPTVFNGSELPMRQPVKTFMADLPTEIADGEGHLRPTKRKTEVRLYEVLPGEQAMLYEMGIPVVETDDKWHVEIQQKIPLNLDRDNVQPSYLRLIRTLVLNEMHDSIGEQDANQAWVREATSDVRCSDGAIKAALKGRYGEKFVAFDPSDLEANKRAVAEGYVVIHGPQMNAQEWDNAKRAQAILPAGQVTPSPKPYSQNGKPEDLIPESEWTEGMCLMAAYAKMLAWELMGVEISVRMTLAGTNFSACYGHWELTFNVRVLGYDWFNKPFTEPFEGKHDSILIHEFAHEYERDHLSESYYMNICDLGARLVSLALSKPEIFAPYRKIKTPKLIDEDDCSEGSSSNLQDLPPGRDGER